jgi:protein-tyrosine-phosphatase
MSENSMSLEVPEILKIVANELRWQIIQYLKHSDYKVSELIERTGAAANQLSYHLAQLRGLDIVKERRSSADSRTIYYSLNVERLQQLFHQAGEMLHPALSVESVPQAEPESLKGPVRVLFLCTHNSARSQMGEALIRHIGKGQIEAFSAGTTVTSVKPEAIETMRRRGIDISHQKSEHLSDYLDMTFEYVITVCDEAREVCPVFPNGKRQLHWSFADPSSVEDPAERMAAFEQVARELTTRIHFLMIMINRDQAA